MHSGSRGGASSAAWNAASLLAFPAFWRSFASRSLRAMSYRSSPWSASSTLSGSFSWYSTRTVCPTAGTRKPGTRIFCSTPARYADAAAGRTSTTNRHVS